MADAVRPGLTIVDLERWVENGAGWRALEVEEERAVIELCTCYGEPVDVLAGAGRPFVDYVRARGLKSDGE